MHPSFTNLTKPSPVASTSNEFAKLPGLAAVPASRQARTKPDYAILVVNVLRKKPQDTMDTKRYYGLARYVPISLEAARGRRARRAVRRSQGVGAILVWFSLHRMGGSLQGLVET